MRKETIDAKLVAIPSNSGSLPSRGAKVDPIQAFMASQSPLTAGLFLPMGLALMATFRPQSQSPLTAGLFLQSKTNYKQRDDKFTSQSPLTAGLFLPKGKGFGVLCRHPGRNPL